MGRQWIIVITMAMLCMCLAVQASAEIPKRLALQGKLTDSSGQALNGSFSITFRIYNAVTAGTKLWEETQTLTVSAGIFSALLGSTTALNLVFDQPYWVEIVVGGEVLSPRQPLAASAYAFRAYQLEGMTVAGGNFGLGTTSPRYKLEVNGTMKGALIASNRNPVGLEFNLLFNAPNRYLVSQTGPAAFNLDTLFDGRLAPSYPTNGPNSTNPQVILIENLPAAHTQAGAWVGWTTRSWPPLKFKLEGYDTYQSANTWRVFADYSTTNYGGTDFLIPVAPGGIYTKLRLTIYEGSGSLDSSGNKRVGLSEIFFIHPEVTRPYAGLLPSSLWEVNGNAGLGTPTPAAKLDIAGFGGSWSTSNWNKAIEIPNGSIIKWEKNSANWRHAIGQTTSGLYFGRAQVDDNSSPVTYNMFIGNTGNVGIGTTGPTDKLSLANPGAGNQVGIRFIDPSATLYGARIYFDDTSNTFRIVTINNNVETLGMVLNRDSGNVGIGTTNPQAKLEVNSALCLTPSGAPANPKAGTIYFNATNKHFYGYDGAAWKQLDN